MNEQPYGKICDILTNIQQKRINNSSIQSTINSDKINDLKNIDYFDELSMRL